MPFYPKIDVVFIEIPSNAGLSINYALIAKEFGLNKDEKIAFRKIMHNPDFSRKEDFLIMPWYYLVEKCPEAINSKNIFSIARNPFARMVSIYLKFSKIRKEYKKYEPQNSDSRDTLKSKFEYFIKIYDAKKNIISGAGLNIIEIIARNFNDFDRSKLIENASYILDKPYYFCQRDYIDNSFLRNRSIFGESIFKNIEIIKLEKIDQIYNKYPQIFDSTILYENFGRPSYWNNKHEIFYNKFTQRYVQENFEKDFFYFHYNFNFKLIN